MKRLILCTTTIAAALNAGCSYVVDEAEKRVVEAHVRNIETITEKAQQEEEARAKKRQAKAEAHERERYNEQLKILQVEIKQQTHRIANEEVAIERLEADAAKLHDRVESDRAEVAVLQKDLDSERQFFTYSGHQFSRQEVEQDTLRRSESLHIQETTLAALNKQLVVRRQSIVAARDKLLAMREARDKIQAQLDGGTLVRLESIVDLDFLTREEKVIVWSPPHQGGNDTKQPQ